MRKARAIAIRRPTAHAQAMESFRNFALFVLDRMYGTPGRSRMTFRIALAVGVLGCFLAANQAAAVPGCLAV